MFSTNYYTIFAYGRSKDFSLIGSHICRANNMAPDQKIEDFRFNENIAYQGIGNSSLMRVNACSALRVHLWCTKPSSSTAHKVAQYFVHLFITPLASFSDALINLSLAVMKVALIPIIFLGKVLHKMFSPSSNVEMKETMSYALRNALIHLFGTTLHSVGYLFYQAITLGTVNLLGPKLNFVERNFDIFTFGYRVNGPKGSENILDTNRVRYLREKCGWTLTDPELQELVHPWKSDTADISYSIEGTKLCMTAKWTEAR